MHDQSPPLAAMAAMLYPADESQEALLCAFVRRWQQRGVRIGGVLQRSQKSPANPKGIMELVDLSNGHTFGLSQDLGTGSSACTLDLSALAQAAVIVRQAVEQKCQLLLVNKFSHQERVGKGLALDMLHAVTQGIPLLTALRPGAQDDWQIFTGGHGAVLAPDPQALDHWWMAHASASPPTHAARSLARNRSGN